MAVALSRSGRRVGRTLLVITLLAAILYAVESPRRAEATVNGEGVMIYSPSGNTTPQTRTYTTGSNSFTSAAGTVAGAAARATVLRTSPNKQEAIAGYVDSGGTLRVLCYNGSTWSSAWSVSVGGTGTTRRFDIAYESSSGDALVMYSTNATSNELAYRTKASAASCTTWSGATTYEALRTTGSVYYVKLGADHRSSSDLITAIWADSNKDLSAVVWTGSALTNEPSAATETTLDTIGTTPDVEDFDVEYESTSGDVMLVWGRAVAASVNGAYYRTCTGGTSACTWNAVTAIPTFADDATNLDISANPTSDEIVFASIGIDSSDMQLGYWTGSSWNNSANVDTSTNPPAAGTQLVATTWITAASNTAKSIIVYSDVGDSDIASYIGDGYNFIPMPDVTPTPAFATTQAYFDLQPDPVNKNKAMLTAVDTNVDLFAKRLSIEAAGYVSWSNSDGSAALDANLNQTSPMAASFAYWRSSSAPTYTEANYQFFGNSDDVQPGSSLASENTQLKYTGNPTSPIRLRTQVGVTGNALTARAEKFELEYSTSTSGPWTSVGSPWWDPAWTERRKITFANKIDTATLTYPTILVTLNASNFDYSKTQANGEDLRFVDDDGYLLDYDIEKWDKTGNSYVWVSVYHVDAFSDTDHMWVYYNNPNAVDVQNKPWTYASNVKMVQHFEEASGNYTDTIDAQNDGTASGTPTRVAGGRFGQGVQFDSNTDIISNAASTVPHQNTFTVEFWVKPDSLPASADWVGDGTSAASRSWEVQTSSSGTGFNLELTGTDNFQYISPPTLAVGTWTHVAFTQSATQTRVYTNGQLRFVGGSTPSTNSVTGYRIGGTNARITMDELRISNNIWSPEWLNMNYRTQSDAMNSYGPEESLSANAFRSYDNPTPAQGASIGSTLLTGSSQLGSYTEYEASGTNPAAVDVGSNSEWDFTLQPVNTTPGQTYYFRMVKAGGAALSSYTQYPSINIEPSLNQESYRWFTNANSTNVGAALAAQDTAITAPAQGVPFRLRTLTHVSGGPYTTSHTGVKLQYSQQSGTCDAGFTGESYVDVDNASGAIRFYNNATPADGTSLTSNGSDPTTGHTKIAQSYEEVNNAPVLATTAAGQDAMWDFSLVDIAAPGTTTYCFRMVRADGSSFNGYTILPELTTPVRNVAPDAPTNPLQKTNADVVIATGKWHNSTTVKFTADITDPDPADTLQLCVEIKDVGVSFTNSPTQCGGTFAYSGSTVPADVTYSSLSTDTQYHWQVATKDSGGLYSSWTPYGGNSDVVTTATDIGIDTSAPTGGTVKDGTTGTDATYNDGALDTLSATWSGVIASTSGLLRYEYSIGTTPGAIADTKGWTSNGTATSVTIAGLNLKTSQRYYFSVRTVDNAGNTSTPITSDGQFVAPTLTFGVGATSISFNSLNIGNNYTDEKTVSLTTSTNAYGGYIVRVYATGPLTTGSKTIGWFNGGTYAAPDSWQGGDTGFGYTSTDPSIQATNKFQNTPNCPGLSAWANPGCYAPFSTSQPGDVVADHDSGVSGTPVSSEVQTLSLRVTAPSTPAGRYATKLVFTNTVEY